MPPPLCCRHRDVGLQSAGSDDNDPFHGSENMNILSPVLGAIDVSDDKVIEFPAGLPGFEQCRRFVLVHDAEQNAGLFMLQSVDDPELVLSITGPEMLRVNYEFTLSDDELEMLELKKPEDAAVAVILSKEEGESPASAGLRGNFMAPLVINTVTRKGVQKIINKRGCELTLRAID